LSKVIPILPPGLRVRGVRKRLGHATVLDGVDLTVARGEVVGVLGPNGAGKTTLMHIVAGLLDADEGEVFVDGLADPRRREVRARVGYAPQATALYDEMTAEENVRFFGRMHGLSGARLKERVEWALEFAGLVSRRHDRVGVYSGGMRRRLHVASALLHAPPLVLLDEPTTGVDPQSRNHLLEGIATLRGDRHAILYATHHLDEARRLCDRVVVVDHGRVVAVETASRLADRHGGDLEAALLALTGTELRDR
jgi:ABC-2 type transport system ATP-binding protein